MLPGVSGIDFTRRLRLTGRGRTIPLLILTARGAEEDRVKGLESGADDYLVKPFSPRELVARLHALLRRSARAGGGARTEAADRVRVGSLDLDAAACRIDASGQPLDLAPAEYRLLQFFMRHTDRVYGRSELLDAVWGNDRFISERTVDVHVARLRRVLESAGVGGYLQTVRSVGYRFSEPVDA